jgi:Glyoxalase-like domain
VARCDALDPLLGALQRAGIDAGRALAVSRATPSGVLQWRIAVRDDGALLYNGAMPTLIEWGSRHPAETMPASGVVLRAVALRGVPPAALQPLAWPGVRFFEGPGPAIEAQLDTPRGSVTLVSD